MNFVELLALMALDILIIVLQRIQLFPFHGMLVLCLLMLARPVLINACEMDCIRVHVTCTL
jgi:hypothetical protein